MRNCWPQLHLAIYAISYMLEVECFTCDILPASTKLSPGFHSNVIRKTKSSRYSLPYDIPSDEETEEERVQARKARLARLGISENSSTSTGPPQPSPAVGLASSTGQTSQMSTRSNTIGRGMEMNQPPTTNNESRFSQFGSPSPGGPNANVRLGSPLSDDDDGTMRMGGLNDDNDMINNMRQNRFAKLNTGSPIKSASSTGSAGMGQQPSNSLGGFGEREKSFMSGMSGGRTSNRNEILNDRERIYPEPSISSSADGFPRRTETSSTTFQNMGSGRYDQQQSQSGFAQFGSSSLSDRENGFRTELRQSASPRNMGTSASSTSRNTFGQSSMDDFMTRGPQVKPNGENNTLSINGQGRMSFGNPQSSQRNINGESSFGSTFSMNKSNNTDRSIGGIKGSQQQTNSFGSKVNGLNSGASKNMSGLNNSMGASTGSSNQGSLRSQLQSGGSLGSKSIGNSTGLNGFGNVGTTKPMSPSMGGRGINGDSSGSVRSQLQSGGSLGSKSIGDSTGLNGFGNVGTTKPKSPSYIGNVKSPFGSGGPSLGSLGKSKPLNPGTFNTNEKSPMSGKPLTPTVGSSFGSVGKGGSSLNPSQGISGNKPAFGSQLQPGGTVGSKNIGNSTGLNAGGPSLGGLGTSKTMSPGTIGSNKSGFGNQPQTGSSLTPNKNGPGLGGLRNNKAAFGGQSLTDNSLTSNKSGPSLGGLGNNKAGFGNQPQTGNSLTPNKNGPGLGALGNNKAAFGGQSQTGSSLTPNKSGPSLGGLGATKPGTLGNMKSPFGSQSQTGSSLTPNKSGPSLGGLGATKPGTLGNMKSPFGSQSQTGSSLTPNKNGPGLGGIGNNKAAFGSQSQTAKSLNLNNNGPSLGSLGTAKPGTMSKQPGQSLTTNNKNVIGGLGAATKTNTSPGVMGSFGQQKSENNNGNGPSLGMGNNNKSPFSSGQSQMGRSSMGSSTSTTKMNNNTVVGSSPGFFGGLGSDNNQQTKKIESSTFQNSLSEFGATKINSTTPGNSLGGFSSSSNKVSNINGGAVDDNRGTFERAFGEQQRFGSISRNSVNGESQRDKQVDNENNPLKKLFSNIFDVGNADEKSASTVVDGKIKKGTNLNTNDLLLTQIKMKKLEVAMDLLKSKNDLQSSFTRNGLPSAASFSFEYRVKVPGTGSIITENSDWIVYEILMHLVQGRGYELPGDLYIGNNVGEGEALFRQEVLRQLKRLTGYDAVIGMNENGKYVIYLP